MMQLNKSEEALIELFKAYFSEDVMDILHLPDSGSIRKYYRIKGTKRSAIGVHSENLRENRAFLSFTKHFLAKGLAVPEVYADHPDQNIYLLEDLGDTTLYHFLNENRDQSDFHSKILLLYKNAIDELFKFQTEGGIDLDYSLCYPRNSFDRQSILWDLNYFKYYFVKLAGINFNEQLLENDFETFTNLLLNAPSDYFLYRDFQSRNIMLKENKLYFIDYQGGRKGALQYDLASLLFDAKADLSKDVRAELLDYYLSKLAFPKDNEGKDFMDYYWAFVMVRIMQAMGAYGYRGFFERKHHFLASIPYAVRNIEFLLNEHFPVINIPELRRVLESITQSSFIKELHFTGSVKLKITICSFAYKKGIPLDNSGNGGGFVFDCRFLPNPGKLEKFVHSTGLDEEVISFLEDSHEVSAFFGNVENIIDAAVLKYEQRKFTHLMVCFGCTGGQHRSVYFAEKLAKYLGERYDLDINLVHRELESKKD